MCKHKSSNQFIALYWNMVQTFVNGGLTVLTVGDQILMEDGASLVRGGWEHPLPRNHLDTWPRRVYVVLWSTTDPVTLFSDKITRKLVFCFHLQSVPIHILVTYMCHSFTAEREEPSFICVSSGMFSYLGCVWIWILTSFLRHFE